MYNRYILILMDLIKEALSYSNEFWQKLSIGYLCTLILLYEAFNKTSTKLCVGDDTVMD